MAIYEYVKLTGVIIPDTVDIDAEVTSEYKSAFGDDLNLDASTPQGLLATAEILARNGVARNNATLANQINPNEAGGIFLDAIGGLTASERIASTYTVAPEVVLAGEPGTLIPISVQVRSAAGFLFSPIEPVTLDIDGNAAVDFQALEPGPIDLPPDTLNFIENGELGLETVNNPNTSIPGVLRQSDEVFRQYRRDTLALQGMSLSEATTSGVRSVSGVRGKPVFRENVSDMSTVIDGVLLVPHSIYVCADGGTDDDVAAMILKKKSGGCNFNGSTTVDVTDPASGQIYPVTFDRPNLIPVLARVTISATSSVADPVGSVKAAILAYAAGLLNNEPGFIVGASVSPFELSGAINREAPSIFVQKLEVSYASVVSFVTVQLPIAIFELATIIENSISVVVN